MYQELLNREKKLAVIGLGYVGLPIALEFAKDFDVIGFDINEARVEMMKRGEDPSSELDATTFQNRSITFTANYEDLKTAHFFVVAVPTPVNEDKSPNLRPVLGASETLGKVIKKGDYIIYESTVYPGCTEEDCQPVLEKVSGLKTGKDFKIGYSPERISPGDKLRTVDKITKIVSGCDAESLEEIAKVYGHIITAGIYKAATIKVAEAAKIIENAQRDINIAFVNELAMIFSKMNINTHDVLAAAGTKWNFLKFVPGLVGGHCIGVDPYYLTHKAEKMGYDPQVILSGRRVNNGMASFLASRTIQMIIKEGKNPSKAKVLVMGITFKENVTDIRNSKVADIIKELKEFSIDVDVADPHASNAEVEHEYGYGLVSNPSNDYDAILVAVNHDAYLNKDEAFFKSLSSCGRPIIVDVKNLYKGKFSDKVNYWAL